jgi:hypothetical protein
MLTRAMELSIQNMDLKPSDQAILAAMLVRAEALRDQGADDVSFCELDGDLQPYGTRMGVASNHSQAFTILPASGFMGTSQWKARLGHRAFHDKKYRQGLASRGSGPINAPADWEPPDSVTRFELRC